MHHAQSIKAIVKKKKPTLSKKNQAACFYFAESHQYWTVDDWKRVVWSDETKINRLGSDGRLWVWKMPGESLNPRLIQPTVKYGGGSVMLWECFTWNGTGQACKIDGKMDADLYVRILEEDLMGSLEEWGKAVGDVIFQQDNDPKHTS